MSDFEEKYNTKHKAISLWKSGIRIAACAVAMQIVSYYISLNEADPRILANALAIDVICLGLMIAEVLGIAEEML